jgi:hypothetical protein
VCACVCMVGVGCAWVWRVCLRGWVGVGLWRNTVQRCNAACSSAGDMPGMRLAANRIVASLARLGYAEERAWSAARSRLAARLGCQSGSDGGDGGGGEEAQRARLAAAVGRAATAQGRLPLEAEGVAFEEAPPRVGAPLQPLPHVKVKRSRCSSRLLEPAVPAILLTMCCLPAPNCVCASVPACACVHAAPFPDARHTLNVLQTCTPLAAPPPHAAQGGQAGRRD